MNKVAIAKLIFDYNFYPRSEIDGYHVNELVGIVKSGVEVDPIVYDLKSLRIVDGFHRVTAYKKLKRKDINSIGKNYKNETQMFEDMCRYNNKTLRPLTTNDHIRCLTLAEELKIDRNEICTILCITREKAEAILPRRAISMENVEHFSLGKKRPFGISKGQLIPLKNTIAHKSGDVLTSEQVVANSKLQGLDQMFYVNQLIMLLEADLLDSKNEKLMNGLSHLNTLLNDLFYVGKKVKKV